jgi:hypothetical protein
VRPSKQGLVVGHEEHVGRHRAGGRAPLDGLGGEVDGDQLVAVLHRGIDGGAFAVDPQMAGRLAGGNAFGQGQVLAVEAVDVDVVEPVRRGDEPLHVGRKPQLVGVGNTAQHTLHLGRARVDEGQRIGHRIGDDQRLLVGRQVQVVRLLAGGNALGLGPGGRVDHADVRVQRIEHEDRVGQLGLGLSLRHEGRSQRGKGGPGNGNCGRTRNKRLHRAPS